MVQILPCTYFYEMKLLPITEQYRLNFEEEDIFTYLTQKAINFKSMPLEFKIVNVIIYMYF